MPSPFPGMDPFIEGQFWQGFHLQMIAQMQRELGPALRPHYVVMVEQRIYIENTPTETVRYVQPDVLIVPGNTRRPRSATAVAPLDAEAVDFQMPMPDIVTEDYLAIRRRDTRDLVTVVEVLPPMKKRVSDGRAEYLRKRGEVLLSQTGMVELDLLRGGIRLPGAEALPVADFYAVVSRGATRPRATAFPWTLRRAMPKIPIPLMTEDGDYVFDLQGAFGTVYDTCAYDNTIDYKLPVEPPLLPEDEEWAAALLRALGDR